MPQLGSLKLLPDELVLSLLMTLDVASLMRIRQVGPYHSAYSEPTDILLVHRVAGGCT